MSKPFLNKLFPGSRVSDIVYVPLRDEPKVVKKFLEQLDTLNKIIL